MIRIETPRGRRQSGSWSRRTFMELGALAPIGLSATASTIDSDRNGILLFLMGGPSHIDTFDPKPDAPAEIRGPFKPISTRSPGMSITEIFPRTAMQADKFSIVRSVYHTSAAVHDTGHQLMQTGRAFTGGIEHPHIGCTLTHLKGSREGTPGHVLLPKPIGKTGGNQPHGQSAGYLGRTHDPFILNADPGKPDFKVPDLLPPEYLTNVRIDRRRSLRESVEAHLEQVEKSSAGKQIEESFDLARKLMASPSTRAAFDLHKEHDSIRDRYGRTRFGQSCLLARRLVERGVRFVTVNMFETVFDEVTWDIHGSRPFTDITEMARLVAPSFDQGYSALLEDLFQRGMLSNTVVTAMGEFGRTPKINPAGGRDHHPGVWSILLGGGTIQPGRVIGSSDELGYAPKTRAANPQEVVATLYKALGVPIHTELPGPQGRPIPATDFSVQPIQELF